jgi:hypothetical protein
VERVAEVELLEVERPAGAEGGPGLAQAEPAGVRHGHDDHCPDGSLTSSVDDQAVDLGDAGDFQVGPCFGRNLRPAAFAEPKAKLGRRYRVPLDLGLPRAHQSCNDRRRQSGPDRWNGRNSGSSAAWSEGRSRRSLRVEDQPCDLHGPLDRHPGPGEGLRPGIDLLGPSSSRGGIPTEDGGDPTADR